MKKELSSITLKFTPSTADRFRKFSRELGKQQSVTLQLMMDFFENNGVSPTDKLVPNFTALEKRIKSRVNTVVAILKDIEKTQTKPTLAMIQSLFEQKPVRKEIRVEKKTLNREDKQNPQKRITENSDTTINVKDKAFGELKLLLEKVELVRSRFGKDHLRLNMTPSEFEQLKYQLKNSL